MITTIASSMEESSSHPGNNDLSDSKVDMQVQRNNKSVVEHSLDGSSPSIEASLEVSEGAPILLDTTIDSAVTMAFIHTPEVFAGRAISESTTPTATSVEDPLAVLLSRAKNSTTSSYTEPSTSTSIPRFARDRSVSLISRALGSPYSNDFYNLTEFRQDPDSALSAHDHSSVDPYSKNQAHSDIRPGTEDSYLRSSTEETHWISKRSKFTFVFPLDAEHTILEIEGERYHIPNSDLWVFPYDKQQVMAADKLIDLIRPSFYASMSLQGPRRAIEAVNGHRLEPNSEQSNRLHAIEITDSAATETAHKSEGQSDTLLPSLSSSILKLANRLEKLSTGLDVERDFIPELPDTPPECKSAPKNVEMDGTLERSPRPLLSPIHLIHSGSLQSVNAVGTPRSDGEYELDFAELCRFVDTVRAALPTQIIKDDDIEQLTEIMHVFLDAECSEGGDEKTGLDLIARIRFDKLLADLLSLKTVDAYVHLVAKASALQLMWKERFRGDYLLIDRERLETMFTHGPLRGLTLETHAETNLPLWLVERGPPITDADLKPGHFWLNLECAYRDGVVESHIEKLTLGRHDSTPILPLLTGIEVYDYAHPDRTRYRKQCRAEDIPFNLMARGEDFKGKIRILRGHGLESKHAPKAGVRYDGEYLITNWAHLPTLNPDLDIRHFELVLQRVPGQRSVQHIPSPAQMDDWYLYQRYVASQRSRALKAYSTLLTEEASSMKDETDRKTDVGNTEWECDQTMDAHSRVVEYGSKHRE